MKPNAMLAAIVCTLIASPAAAEAMFKFDGGIGSQPLRAGPAGSVVANTVAGVAPGGAPWPIDSLKAEVGHDGRIRAHVKGVLLGGTDNIGTRGGPRRMVISLFCRNPPSPGAVAGTLQTEPYNSEFRCAGQPDNGHACSASGLVCRRHPQRQVGRLTVWRYIGMPAASPGKERP
jgi:hypothetical protein